MFALAQAKKPEQSIIKCLWDDLFEISLNVTCVEGRTYLSNILWENLFDIVWVGLFPSTAHF